MSSADNTFSLDDLETSILNYVNDNENRYAISVEGRWGTGKTYFFEHQIRELLHKNKKKLVRVSLFGVSSAEEATNRLNSALFQVNAPKQLPRFQKGLKQTLSRVTSSVGIPLGKYSMSVAVPLQVISDWLIIYALNNDVVIAFDDIERRSTSSSADTNLFGMINDLVESHGAKVIFIMNSDSDQTGTEFDKDIREKLIWKSYFFNPTCSYLIGTVFHETLNGTFDIHRAIITAAERVQCDNFRAILRAKQFITELASVSALKKRVTSKRSVELAFTDIVSYAFFVTLHKDKKPLENETTDLDETSVSRINQPIIQYSSSQISRTKFDSFPVNKYLGILDTTKSQSLEEDFTTYTNKWYNVSEETYRLFEITQEFESIRGYNLSDEQVTTLANDLSGILQSGSINIQYIVEAIHRNRYLFSLGESSSLNDDQLMEASFRTITQQNSLEGYKILALACDMSIDEGEKEFLRNLKNKVIEKIKKDLQGKNLAELLDIWSNMIVIDQDTSSEWLYVLLDSVTPDRFTLSWKTAGEDGQEDLRKKIMRLSSSLRIYANDSSQKQKINTWIHSLINEVEALPIPTGTFSRARHTALLLNIKDLELK